MFTINFSISHYVYFCNNVEVKLYYERGDGRPVLDVPKGAPKCLFLLFKDSLSNLVDALVGINLDKQSVGTEAV